jgi:hypothetical protein
MSRGFVICLIISIIVEIGFISMCILSGYFMDHYYNTLACGIDGVTQIDSAYNKNQLYWFFQYNYWGENCTYGWKVGTAYSTSYQTAIDLQSQYMNKSSVECYALKNSDPCSVFATIPSDDRFIWSMVLGFFALLMTPIIAKAILEWCRERQSG